MIKWLWPYDMHEIKFFLKKYYEKCGTHIANIFCQRDDQLEEVL